MNIQELLKASDVTNITISVTPADLKEFALAVVDELRSTETKLEQKKCTGTDVFMSVGEAAKYIGKTKNTLWRWEKEKYLLPTSRIGNTPVYSKATLDGILSSDTRKIK